MLVRVLERERDVAEDRDRVASGIGPSFDPAPQRGAIDERHRVERQPARLTGAEHWNNARILQLRGDPDLTLEPLRRHVRGKLGAQHLHDDSSPEPPFLGEEDARHSSAAELALDGVGRPECGLELVLEAGRHRAKLRQIGVRVEFHPSNAPSRFPLRAATDCTANATKG